MRITSNWPARRTNAVDFFEQMDRLLNPGLNLETASRGFDNPARSFQPAYNLTEQKDHYLMTVELPGVKKENVKIDYDDNVLTIFGERKRDNSEATFTRSFTLPTNIDVEAIEAHHEDGVLSVYLPKTSATKARKIEVQAKSGGFFERLLSPQEKTEENIQQKKATPSH